MNQLTEKLMTLALSSDQLKRNDGLIEAANRIEALEKACEPFVRYFEYIKKNGGLHRFGAGPQITIEQQQALLDLFPPPEPELPDCVFCGEKCVIDFAFNDTFVTCSNKSCRADGPIKPTEAEAIAAYKVKGSK